MTHLSIVSKIRRLNSRWNVSYRYGGTPICATSTRSLVALIQITRERFASSLSLSKNMRDCRRRLHLSRVTPRIFPLAEEEPILDSRPNHSFFSFLFFYTAIISPILRVPLARYLHPIHALIQGQLPSAITSPRTPPPPPRAFPPFHCGGKKSSSTAGHVHEHGLNNWAQV